MSVCLAYMPDGRSHELLHLTSLVEYFLTDTALFRKNIMVKFIHLLITGVKPSEGKGAMWSIWTPIKHCHISFDKVV